VKSVNFSKVSNNLNKVSLK